MARNVFLFYMAFRCKQSSGWNSRGKGAPAVNLSRMAE